MPTEHDSAGQDPLQRPRPKTRRKTSGLGSEPRGDTGAAALATLSTLSPVLQESSPTPVSRETKQHRISKRRKAKSLFKRWVRFSLRHTWVNPLLIIIAVLGAYYISPGESNPLHKAIFLSYPLPRPLLASQDTPIQYGKGKNDFAFVAFYTIVFSFTREFLMQRLIRPLAVRWQIRSRAKQARFMEQFYTAIYFFFMGPCGLYVMSRTPVWYFRTTPMFENFPHKTHEGIFKAYYLLQASYWAQQGLVLLLMLEKPRKDFKELVLHHVVTLALIWCSYRFHFAYIGVAVYITHDISDFFLATSKVLNYLDSPITGPYFVFFIGTWIYLRHYVNLRILYAVVTEFRTVGPFELNWETQQYKCLLSQCITFGLLGVLQAVNLFWLFLILRIAYRYVKTTVDLKDDRSDDEDELEEEERQEEKQQQQQQQQQQQAIANGDAKASGVEGLVDGPSAAAKKRHGAANGSPQVLVNGTPI